MRYYGHYSSRLGLAGANWEDSEVRGRPGDHHVSQPSDLDAFSAKIIEEVKEGRHKQRSAA